KGGYQQEYSADEVVYFKNKTEQKYQVIEKIFSLSDGRARTSLLDIGSGEGWVLHFFKEKGWQVAGVDFSEFGCKKFNPDCVDDVRTGDLYENLQVLIDARETFDVIWLDNVLEHIIDPLLSLQLCRGLVSDGGVLVVEVPNDFSLIQEYALQKGYVAKEFWVALPDHLSYFNKAGLTALAKEARWKCSKIIGDFPIDFNLINTSANYIADPAKGKACHRARVEIENLLHGVSVEKTIAFYETLANLGLGRQIIGFFVC
ncbi:MAG: Methyltransferase type 12, partial [Candidatus Magasanikbacteria bacterium GW2011_GWC2_45_8]